MTACLVISEVLWYFAKFTMCHVQSVVKTVSYTAEECAALQSDYDSNSMPHRHTMMMLVQTKLTLSTVNNVQTV